MKNGFLNGLMAAATLIVLFFIINAVNPKFNFNLLYMVPLSAVIYLLFIFDQEGMNVKIMTAI